MKKIFALLLAASMIFSQSAYALEYGQEWANYSEDAVMSFSDVTPAHWAYNAIERIKSAGWVSGYPDGTFRPNQSISREEAIVVIVKFLGLELKETVTSSFADVDKGRWSSPYIEAGKLLFPQKQTFNGQSPFQPEMPVLREDVMYAIVVAKKYNDKVQFADQSVLNMFSDKNSISANLKSWVATAVTAGLVSGHANGSIGAQDPLTRAEFASLLYRAQQIGDGTGGGLSSVPTIQSVTVGMQIVTSMMVDDEIYIYATANMSDGTTMDYSENLSPYNSSNNNVITTNRNKIKAVNAGTAVIRFNNDSFLADKEYVINVSAPEVTHSNYEVRSNQYDQDQYNQRTTTIDNNYPVDYSQNSGNTNNSANTASINNRNNTRDTVNTIDDDEEIEETVLSSIKWSVDSLSLNAGESARIRLIGVYTDGSEKDITSNYDLYSYDDSVAEVNGDTVTALQAGTTRIGYAAGGTASIGTARPLSVTVAAAENAEIVSLKWSTGDVTLSAGEAVEVRLIGVFSDGSEKDVTDECAPYVDNEGIAIYENGMVKAISAGKTDLWLEFMPTATVILPKLLNITVQ